MMGFVALVFSTIFIWFLGVVVGVYITEKSIIKDSNRYNVTRINSRFYYIKEITNAPTKGTNRNPY